MPLAKSQGRFFLEVNPSRCHSPGCVWSDVRTMPTDFNILIKMTPWEMIKIFSDLKNIFRDANSNSFDLFSVACIQLMIMLRREHWWPAPRWSQVTGQHSYTSLHPESSNCGHKSYSLDQKNSPPNYQEMLVMCLGLDWVFRNCYWGWELHLKCL